MKLVVISGLSGAGKAVTMHALEDFGFFCVDNLPLNMLPALAREMEKAPGPANQRAAAVIDARSYAYGFERFPELLEVARGEGLEVEVVFLEAADDILIKRFSETRRKHPLTDGRISLAEAIRRERELLDPVRRRADLCIDTTRLHLHQLRDLVRGRLDRGNVEGLTLMFQSFGYKNGVPPDADMVFDVRWLPNPYWEPALRSLTGRDPRVAEWLGERPEVVEMRDSLVRFLEPLVPRFEADNRAYLTVAVGCTGGQHRSVYLAERLAEHFSASRADVIVRHRELA